jgi:hypothetical protein
MNLFWAAIFQPSGICHHCRWQGCNFRPTVCLALTVSSSEGFFYMPHLLQHRSPVCKVISERPVILISECRALGEGAITTYSKRLRFDVARTSGARTHDLLSESSTTRLPQPVNSILGPKGIWKKGRGETGNICYRQSFVSKRFISYTYTYFATSSSPLLFFECPFHGVDAPTYAVVFDEFVTFWLKNINCMHVIVLI